MSDLNQRTHHSDHEHTRCNFRDLVWWNQHYAYTFSETDSQFQFCPDRSGRHDRRYERANRPGRRTRSHDECDDLQYLQNSEYHLTNGVFEGGSVLIGTPVSGREPITHFTGTNVVGPICLATGEREKTEKLVTEK